MDAPQIIEIANLAIKRYWRKTGDVSEATRAALTVCDAWQEMLRTLNNPELEYEVAVGAGMDERIDVVDFGSQTAFELKVSPNNPHFEFYKNVFKVIQFNKSFPERKLKRLLFLNPGNRGAKLRDGLGGTALSVARDYEIEVEIVRMIE